MTTAYVLEVRTNKPEAVAAYLPANFTTVDLPGMTDDGVIMVAGYDSAGWTARDYVIPRLASGLHFARIVAEWEKEES